MNPSRNVIARLLHAFGIGRITVVDDTGSIQKLQVSEAPGPDGSLGITDGVLRVVQFGFSSNPPIESEVVLCRLWGNRTLTLGIGTNHQPSRMKNLKPGDSAMHDVRNAYLWFTENGPVLDAAGLAVTIQNATTVTIKASTKVRCETPLLECTGDVVGNCETSPISLTKHLHPLTGGPETGAPLPE